MPVRDEIPNLPGPTTDRLLMVRLKAPVFFKNIQLDIINTQHFGIERHGPYLLDMSTVVLRASSHKGAPLLCVGYESMVRCVPWSQVYSFTPHPHFTLDHGPVFWDPPGDGYSLTIHTSIAPSAPYVGVIDLKDRPDLWPANEVFPDPPKPKKKK